MEKLEQESTNDFMAKSLMDQKLKQDDDVTGKNVNQAKNNGERFRKRCLPSKNLSEG